MEHSTSPVAVVVGAGPVGLCVALELDRHGVPVLIIEPRSTVEHSRPRAKTTSARSMEHLRRWGLADRVRAAAALPADWSSRVTFVKNVTGEEIAHLDGCLGLGVDESISPERGQQIGQGVVEEVLRDAVSERPGIERLFGWRAVRVVQDQDDVTVSAIGPAGIERAIRASWVIGADGPRSVVRAAMDAHYSGEAGGRPNVNITFRSAELAGRIPHAPSIQYWVLDPHSPGVVGPLDREGAWWAISTGTERIDTEDDARAIVRGLVGADIDVEIVATDPWQAKMLIVDRYRNGRMFLAGDAAHQNPPWGGHGFNTGVGDAVNLGWKLAAVVNGWAPSELLDSYEPERRPVALQTIDLARSNMASLSIDLGDAALTGPDAGARAAAAERLRRLKRSEFHSDGLVFGYGYGPDAGAQAPASWEYIPALAAGNRLPHRLVAGVPIFDLLGIEMSVVGPEAAARPLVRAARARGIPLTHVDADGPVVLVRPDQHVAWTGPAVSNADEILSRALLGFGPSTAVASAASDNDSVDSPSTVSPGTPFPQIEGDLHGTRTSSAASASRRTDHGVSSARRRG